MYDVNPSACKVLLDAGHGPYRDSSGEGWEPGALGPEGLTERYLVQKQAERVQQLLRDAGFGKVDIAPRPNSLRGIGQSAEGYNLFISLHLNAFDKKVRGSEVFVHPNGAKYDRMLAQHIQDRLIAEVKHRDRGVKAARLAVLSAVPPSVEAACLVESFFVDSLKSKTEGLVLIDSAAFAVADAIHRYWTIGRPIPVKV
jgi:N-acetylmuramoyl-L-alanine amidase